MATRTQITDALAALGDAVVAAVDAIKAPAPTPAPTPASDEPIFLDSVLTTLSDLVAKLDDATGRSPSLTPPTPAGAKREPAINPTTGRVE